MVSYNLFKSGISNNGKSVRFESISNYKKAARVYSEGDKDLEQLLITCFKMNIATVGCCRGHAKQNNKPYISFRLDSFNNYLCYILYLLNELRVKFVFSMSKDHNNQLIIENYLNLSTFFSVLNEMLIEYNYNIDYFNFLPIDLRHCIELLKMIDNDNYDVVNDHLQVIYAKTYDDRYCYAITSGSDVFEEILLRNQLDQTLDGNFMIINSDRRLLANTFFNIKNDSLDFLDNNNDKIK